MNNINSAAASASSSESRHDDESALTEFLSSLMDYTPTVFEYYHFSLCLWFLVVIIVFILIGSQV